MQPRKLVMFRMNPGTLAYMHGNKHQRKSILQFAAHVYLEMDIYSTEDAVLWLSLLRELQRPFYVKFNNIHVLISPNRTRKSESRWPSASHRQSSVSPPSRSSTYASSIAWSQSGGSLRRSSASSGGCRRSRSSPSSSRATLSVDETILTGMPSYHLPTCNVATLIESILMPAISPHSIFNSRIIRSPINSSLS